MHDSVWIQHPVRCHWTCSEAQWNPEPLPRAKGGTHQMTVREREAEILTNKREKQEQAPPTVSRDSICGIPESWIF